MPTESLDMFTALEMLGRMSLAQWRVVLAAIAGVADGSGYGTITLVVVDHRVRRIETTVSVELPKPAREVETVRES